MITPLLLGACMAFPDQVRPDQQSSQTGTPVGAGTDQLAPGNEASPSTALEAASGQDPAPAIRWHREGGFAGFCDDIAIYPTGDVTISTCRGNQSQELAHIHLDAGQQATLNDWLVQLQSFKLEHKDPAVADALAVRVQFNGVGNAVASAAERAAIADFAQNLLNGLGETPAALMGAVYTNAQSGLSLQYPADAVRFENARPAVDGALAQLPNTVSFINGEPNFALTITWFDLAADATLRSFIDAHSECPDTTATGGQPFQIDGGEALIFPNAPCGPYGGTYLFTLVESRGYRFTIESMASYDEIRGNVEAILNSVHFTPFHAAESAPARCLPPTDDARLLLEGANGYCLLYPHSYIAAHLPDGATELVTQSLMNHTDPRVSIAVEEANGRTLEQVAADWESIYAHQGIDSQRGSITVDGVAAMMLDNLPGQDLNRRVVLVHNDRVYSFFFTPLGDEGDARANMEAFYQDILDSFRFLEAVVVQPLPRPDAADVVETDVQFIRALVNVNMRSGPGATYGIVGSVFAGQTAQVTGAMPDGSWWRVICPDGSTGSCFVVNDPSLTQPAARPEDAASLSDTGEAIVENLSVNLLESFPVQVHAVVRGQLPDACSFIESTGVNVEGTTFHIRMTTARHPNQRCAPMPTPFEEVVPLGAAGLPAGEYVVRVNELTATFTLSVDNGSTSAAETLVYEDTAAGFAFDYPATWTVSGGESGARGAITQLAAPDGTQLDVAVLAWDPQNDLDAYVATRKIAWEASGITILQADAWTLGSGQAAMHFVIRGADGASTGFYLFAALSTRYLTLSGSGDFDVLDAIGQSLRITE
ncbi:MAG: hypothetical protein KDE46_07120 [Caldilineaceae bacterium]|nr:hypothetical protein [Caldilineaceae bacterium]